MSLVAQCYSTLTSGRCNWDDLEALPQSMLLMMLKRCTEERAGLAVSYRTRLDPIDSLHPACFFVAPCMLGFHTLLGMAAQ